MKMIAVRQAVTDLSREPQLAVVIDGGCPVHVAREPVRGPTKRPRRAFTWLYLRDRAWQGREESEDMYERSHALQDWALRAA